MDRDLSTTPVTPPLGPNALTESRMHLIPALESYIRADERRAMVRHIREDLWRRGWTLATDLEGGAEADIRDVLDGYDRSAAQTIAEIEAAR